MDGFVLCAGQVDYRLKAAKGRENLIGRIKGFAVHDPKLVQNSWICNRPETIDRKSKDSAAFCAAMSTQEKASPPANTAARAQLLRKAMGYQTAIAFASYLGVSAQRWNNIETGMPLSRDMAFLLVQKCPGLSLDWLYFGKADGLPLELARRLGVFESGASSTTRA